MHIHAFSRLRFGMARVVQNELQRIFARSQVMRFGYHARYSGGDFDVEIRQQLTKDKLSTQEWVAIIKAAHEAGIKTTSTIMYGHIDQLTTGQTTLNYCAIPKKKRGGFNEFVPLGLCTTNQALQRESRKSKCQARHAVSTLKCML